MVWIGGIIFLVGIALPALRLHGGTQTSEVMKNISKRFTPLANASIAILVGTGALLLFLQPAGWHGSSGHFLSAKIAIFVAMVAIHVWRVFALPGKVARAGNESQRSRLQSISLSLVRVNLALGVAALLVTAAANS